jgi:putative N-acetylmannosamine-6-phosphate epimerase
MINLKDIAKETKTATLDYPGKKGFKVTVNLVTRTRASKIHKESLQVKMNDLGVMEESINEDKFNNKFVSAAISGWEGLTGAHIKDMLPVDEDAIADEDTIEYTHDNAMMLVQQCGEFDKWLNEVVFKLRHFRRN